MASHGRLTILDCYTPNAFEWLGHNQQHVQPGWELLVHAESGLIYAHDRATGGTTWDFWTKLALPEPRDVQSGCGSPEKNGRIGGERRSKRRSSENAGDGPPGMQWFWSWSATEFAPPPWTRLPFPQTYSNFKLKLE